jgi:thioredoxin-related protein
VHKAFIIGLLICLTFWSSCQSDASLPLLLWDKNTRSFVSVTVIDSLTKQSVIIAYDPECPVCRLYKNSIDYLSKTFVETPIYIILTHESDTGFLEGRFYDNPNLIVMKDVNNRFLKKIGAIATPHAFVFDPKGNLIYDGKMDNTVISLGVKNATPDSFFVTDALLSLQKQTTPHIRKTVPIGCLIQ